MYRILSLRSLTQSKNKVLVNRTAVTRVNSHFACLQKVTDLCNRHVVSRLPGHCSQCFQSTSSTVEVLSTVSAKKGKRRKANANKFTELLKVTDSSTKETRTSVQKLKAQKLADFINHQITADSVSQDVPEGGTAVAARAKLPRDISRWSFEETPVIYIGRDMQEMDLSQETLTEILESYHILKEVHEKRQLRHVAEEDLETAMVEEFLEPSEALEVDLLEKEAHVATIPKRSRHIKGEDGKQKKFVSKYYETSENEQQARHRTFQMTLHAYLDICLTTGMINRAYATVLNYRHKRKRSSFGVGLYNQLLHAYAEKGNISRIRDILRILRDDGIAPTAQTYAAVFECLGRLEVPAKETQEQASHYLQEATSKGFSMTDILNQSKFVRDQREMVLSLFETMAPGFRPVYQTPTLTYNNHLVNVLNEHVRPVDTIAHTAVPHERLAGAEVMNSKAGFSKAQLEDFSKQQVEMELNGYLKVRSIERFPERTELVLNLRKELEELKKVWTKQIAMAFHRDFNTLKAVTESKASRSINLFPYLKALTVGQFTEILIDEVQMLLEGSDTFSFVVSHLHRELGKKVESRYHVEQKRQNGLLDKTCDIYRQYADVLADGYSSDNPRQLWQRLVYENSNNGPNMDIQSVTWPKAAVSGVGKFLYNILKRDLKINLHATTRSSRKVKLVPAFYSLFRYESKMAKEQIKPHPVLMKLYRKAQPDTLKFDVNLVPMLCPPQPWSTPVNGGYILARSELIRLPHQAHQQLERIAEANAHDMYPTLDSLNQLASIPWEVNGAILDVILQVFNSGGNSKLDIPEPPHALPPVKEPASTSKLSGYERFNLVRQKINHRRKQGDMYSLWCDALYRLSLASHYRDKVFWLPQNIDFRGRVYPIPPHLNHLGHDMARCLLTFHQKKPLGPDGFRWLKLHCINLTGLKKRDSVADRLTFADEIMDDILDSADNPLGGRMWWAESDEPWQTLSCCMEIAKVHRCPDPEKFESGFPIHQDGSCNGLQHYAALGRDTLGAVSVNLAPAEVPQDVYSAVAALVEENRARDARNNVKVAKHLEGFIKRKVIKQTVMTTVYGVTRFGARKQIARQLDYIDEFPSDWVWPASSYLTMKTFDALSEMFTSAKEIQDWFTDCARLISAVCAQNVEWVTPLGLPVVQPYNRTDRPVSKSVQIPEHFSMDLYEKPNIMKQKNAFPPNFVHSLDSSHMMLTSLYCERAGLTFISVHDCYWTHACTVPVMNKICREQFVALHSEPILEDLSKFLVQKYSYDENEINNDGSVIDLTKRKLNRILRQYPDKGDFDLHRVLNSVYFFS